MYEQKIYKNKGGYTLISNDSTAFEIPTSYSVTYGVGGILVYCDEEGPIIGISNEQGKLPTKFDQKSSTQALFDNSGILPVPSPILIRRLNIIHDTISYEQQNEWSPINDLLVDYDTTIVQYHFDFY